MKITIVVLFLLALLSAVVFFLTEVAIFATFVVILFSAIFALLIFSGLAGIVREIKENKAKNLKK